MPKVSVIIPVYNVEDYIKECLDSVVNQTMQDIEIVCVNDFSTDNSTAILNDYAQKDSRIVIINNELNKGVGITKNIGQKNATGDYIFFVDPDDYIALDACEKLYNQAIKDNADAVYCNVYKFIDGTDEFKLYKNYEKIIKKFDAKFPFPASKCYRYLDNQSREVCFKLYNRKFLEANGITTSEHRLCEDTIFRLKFLLANPLLSILDEPLYFYRARATSLVHQSEAICQVVFDVHEKYMDILLNSNLSYKNKIIFFKNQITWLIRWNNRNGYSEKTKKENQIIRKKLNEKYLKFFAFEDLKKHKFKKEFWDDVLLTKSDLLVIYNGKKHQLYSPLIDNIRLFIDYLRYKFLLRIAPTKKREYLISQIKKIHKEITENTFLLSSINPEGKLLCCLEYLLRKSFQSPQG